MDRLADVGHQGHLQPSRWESGPRARASSQLIDGNVSASARWISKPRPTECCLVRPNRVFAGLADGCAILRAHSMTIRSWITYMNEAAREVHRSLAARFHGDLLRPGDPSYEAARGIWNGMGARTPELIARCADVVGIQSAVRACASAEALTAVRCGG